MTENRSNISRRRVIVGAGAGAAAMWAAPAITTLGTAAGATGSCVKGGSVFKFVAAGSTPGTGASLTGPLVSGAYALAVVQGNVDYVGPGTGFVAGYTSVKTVDLTGDGSVTVTELTGATLLLGNYVVELDVYGSTLFPVPAGPSGNPNNQIEVKIGGTTLIGPVSPPDGPGTLTQLSGTATGISGLLTLIHTSPADFQGLFLSRLEVFDASCQ